MCLSDKSRDYLTNRHIPILNLVSCSYYNGDEEKNLLKAASEYVPDIKKTTGSSVYAPQTRLTSAPRSQIDRRRRFTTR